MPLVMIFILKMMVTTRFTFNLQDNPEIDVAGILTIDPVGGGTSFDSHITASGNISASGGITASNFSASTDISAAGTITAEQLTSTDGITAAGTIGAAQIDVGGGFGATGVTIESDGNTSIDGNTTINGIVDLTGTTDATNDSGDTGILRVEGGASIAKKVFVGTDLIVTGDITASSITASAGFTGSLKGTADIATTVTITDNESTDEDNAVVFTAGGDVDGGNLGLESDGNLVYNPSTGRITATQLGGTLTTAAQGNVTSLGTLTGLNVDSHITASGNISASGAITASSITASHGFTGSFKGDGNQLTFDSLTVDDITINGSTISDAADLTIDVGGDIILDAAGDDIRFKDAGDTRFGFNLTDTPELDVSGDFTIDGTGDITLDSATDVVSLIGNVTASGVISSSGGITTNHITASGNISSSVTSTGSFGGIQIPDNGRITIGDANDLQLYHNGNHSFIEDSGTGNLITLTNLFQVKNAANNQTMIQANQGGAVQLLHANSQKFITNAGGVNITGNITASGNISASGIISASEFGPISSSGTGIFNKLEIHGADGTLAADYIIHKDDENTKFGFPSNDHFKIRTAGVDRYVVDTVHQFTGEITTDNHITIANNKEIKQDDSGGTARTIIELDSSNDLNIGGSYAGSLKIIGGGSYAEVARFDDGGHFLQASGKGITTNHITASGNISASGIIFADSIEVTHLSASFTTSSRNILIQNITSSGDSIFGDAIGDTHTFNGHITASGNISGSATSNLSIGSISASNNIYAVGNISASGDILAKRYAYKTIIFT